MVSSTKTTKTAQVFGPHVLFRSEARQHPHMYNMKPDAICDWLMALPENAPPRRVNALHLQVQVTKIKRFCYLIKNARFLTSIPPSFRNLPLASTPVISSVCTSLNSWHHRSPCARSVRAFEK
jgi:hypothetical protein